MSLSKPKGISCWERRRDPVSGYHRFAGMASNENPAGEEWGLCSPAGTSERAAVGWRSCCGGKPGLGEVSVPWCPCSGCVCSGCNVCVPQPGVGVTAQDLASQCLVLNLAALGCPERSLFPREEIPAGPCSSSPVKAAESPGWVEGTLFPLPEQGWVIQPSLSERSSPTDGLGWPPRGAVSWVTFPRALG